MEAPDQEAMGSNSSSSTGECPYPAVVKRKRTKRQRALPSPPPPLPSAAVAATSSDSSAEFSATTEEEEDMAHCLILLAQGRGLNSPPEDGGGGGTEKFTSRRFTEAAATAGGKAGFCVYECKTCNKCFPSFQALGGHRASHKKSKVAIPLAAIEDKKSIADEDGLEISMNSFSKPPIAVHANSSAGNKLRVHECSICGSEFSSGQALGGHMRRHRPTIVPESQEVKKERNVLSLDLNLPAPSDENPGEFHKPPPPPPSVTFAFADKRPMVFSATAALVDCHF